MGPIYGMRGTEELAPEQRPGLRKMRGRAQPYRKRRGRPLGPTLDAMLRGGPTFLRNPAEYQRERKRAFAKAYGRRS